MEAPQLKLVILKGPREGETFEYGPGSKFKIGRLVRGKNVSIKDDAISSTHLEIVSDTSSSAQCQWFVKDLDSSNGTTLNDSSPLPPNKPFPLRDGDVIKLGELTSILVRLVANQSPDEISEAVRPCAPSPRRKFGAEILDNRRRVGARKARVLDKESVEIAGSVVGEKQELQKVEVRMTRAAARVVGDDLHQVLKSRASHRMDDTDNKENKKLIQIEGRRRRAAARSRQDDPKQQVPQLEVSNQTGADNVNVGSVALPVSNNNEVRVQVKEEIVDDLEEIGVVKENPRRGESGNALVLDDNARRIDKEQRMHKMEGRHDLNGLRSMDVGDRADGDFGVEAQKGNDNVDVGGEKEIEGETENREELNCEKGANMSDLKEGRRVNEGARECAEELGKQQLNLEKMTLGEWFNYLEVHLPNHIVDATEEMIEEMQRKAERVHAYMMEQNNKK